MNKEQNKVTQKTPVDVDTDAIFVIVNILDDVAKKIVNDEICLNTIEDAFEKCKQLDSSILEKELVLMLCNCVRSQEWIKIISESD